LATIQGNLPAAQAAAGQLAKKEARDRAAIEQAGIDEPVNHAGATGRAGGRRHR
jgi:hypothetical protein